MPLAGSAKAKPVKGLASRLSRGASIEVLKEFSKDVPFEPVEHSVYEGRERLGRYLRISPTLYAAFDVDDRPLGEFLGRRAAYAAVASISGGSRE
ncbi:hypothetical protein IVB40_31755 [Bradyrhizobium sp. 40]|uniref:hypothetical protein n=1 Tax=Bradyrhizobium sp. 40 TaxID=2782674 RepID=UPI001FFE87BA|nr:hypothetical protein [Bradyrhizobium sp. 40]UPJ41808.1 hypothetical protein IVB40_31755 [Bradyrhizobium sp. 40]